MRTAGGLAAVGAIAGLLLAAGTVSYFLWTAPQPGDPTGTRAGTMPRRAAEAEPVALAENSLEFPVLVLPRVRLQDTFQDPRADGARTHHALDIMAPRHTPVRAVDDGMIVRLSSGGAGGLAVYQVDPTGGYCFYYAHLEAYAPALQQGQQVRRGEVIGYVGTTGNAPESAPHLHFAIFQLRDRNRWWDGRAINPYPLLKLSANLTADRSS